ncbi:MAG: hypothetical protein HZA32_03785 [Opitutae bacterium]|nr:hypothetical protein [Opitutae bacterium]
MKKIAAALLFVAMGVSAFACRCGDRPAILDATAKADAIFVGRVTKLSIAYRKFDDVDGYREVIECEFRVTVGLKGVEAKEEQKMVVTSSAGPACGYPFRIGDEYLVYARRHAQELETDICTRTRPRVIVDEKQDFSDISKIKADDALQTEVPLIREALERK